MDRLVEEDAMVEELVDVVVVDVQIMAENLMALKMRLLVVNAVVRLIKEDMDVGVGMGMDVVEPWSAAACFYFWRWWRLPPTSCSLGIPYQTARCIIRVWLAEGRVQWLPESGARNIKLTDDMQAFILDKEEKLYNSLSPP